MAISAPCTCLAEVEAEREEEFPDAFLSHVRSAHPDWPFPDLSVRVVGEALLRLNGPGERLDAIGSVVVEPVVPPVRSSAP